MIATPGVVGTHHCAMMKPRAVAIMAPHSGIGGCAPIPRKPRPAAVRMMLLIANATRTTIEGTHSGMMCRATMRLADAPVRRCAEMKSARLMASVSARASRANGGHEVSAMAITALLPSNLELPSITGLLQDGGLLSLLIVFTITYSGSRIGITATVGILIAGQLAMGAVIDRFGLFGADVIPLGWPRLLGIALLAGGAALSLHR